MRLSTSMIYQNGLNGILNQEAALSRLQEQLASGKRVLTPGDDPLAASLAVNVAQTASMNKNYSANRATLKQSLGAEENALSSAVTTLQDVMKRVVEAGNGTMSDADRQTLSNVLKGARDQLLSLANSTDGNGQYLFSGYQGNTQPFVIDASGNVSYNGDKGQRMVQADQSRQLAGSDIGTDIFGRAVPGTLSYIASAGAANKGTGQFSTVSLKSPGAGNFVGADFSISFANNATTGKLEYTVTSSSPAFTPITAEYQEGANIDMGGVSLSIKGKPQAGDAFQVEMPSSKNMDMFGTLNDLIQTLENPISGSDVQSVELVNKLATANKSLSLGLDNILTVRASVGSRLNELDALDATGTLNALSYTKQLSDLEETDVYSTTTELLLRQVALQAASGSFSKIIGSSLFSTNR
ncbi:flagellar hook-associated protein FlgL [Bordetella avium]|uniref:flagellar hook-associated protein FlgL n=1 Tax=Bordetella avium TaxID=521 RepID=UPI000E0C8696|nr:flagellar hook-associated protein FlgL [Bordetella avium]RIQ11536.1 flagellar hook-associated protein 3 [Bordetella avium]RIQ34930.1 flagellar hook-associated protein 3 [Bordetella avium]RIQ38256.1 flagellar hook-associated protein 3 [Bordetella avium]RIQ39278.1 flagellar hook-associated protein 3 [Bordetella avium]RIQ44911.1 flagellar hook-associated protein 3 [Bordetella avium]